MSSRKENLLVDLARVVERHGADEVLALARTMRDPAAMNDLAGMLERLVEGVRQTPRKSKGRARSRSTSPRRNAVRTALQESYTTLESLSDLFERLKIDPESAATVEDAHRMILARLDSVASTDRIEDDIIDGSTRPGGELGQLTDAIVSKRTR